MKVVALVVKAAEEMPGSLQAVPVPGKTCPRARITRKNTKRGEDRLSEVWPKVDPSVKIETKQEQGCARQPAAETWTVIRDMV